MTHGAEYMLTELARMLQGQLVGDTQEDRLVRFLLIDSRKLLSPAHSLFFALKTKQGDGHLYIEELLRKGVRAFVVEKLPQQLQEKYPDALFIVLPDSLDALQRLATMHRRRFQYPLVAITGSNGKTVVKEWLFQALSDKYHLVRNPKSYNSQIGVPLSVWLMTKRHQMGLFEAGISTPDEMDRLAGILAPTTGIFTNIGPAHDAGFSSRTQKIREKLKLFTGCRILIYCRDHEDVHREIEGWKTDAWKHGDGASGGLNRRTEKSGEGESGDLNPEAGKFRAWKHGDGASGGLNRRTEKSGEGESGDLNPGAGKFGAGKPGNDESEAGESGALKSRGWKADHPGPEIFSWGRHQEACVRIIQEESRQDHSLVSLLHNGRRTELTIPFTDSASVENALHVAVYLKMLGEDADYISRRIQALQPVAMRLEMKDGLNGCTIINDSYNSDLHSLSIALDFLTGQTRHKSKTLILSDILQSGLPATKLYEGVALMLQAKQIDRLVGIGPEISSCAGQFDLPARFHQDTDDFISQTDFSAFENEAILLKGARKFGFERVSNILQQKDHQTTLDIDLDALVHNLNVYRSMLEPGCRVMGMVKAFSYGIGSVEVARVLQYHRVDCLAVAYADEGKVLRSNGVDLPIVVMNPELRTFDTMLDYRLEPEIYGFSLLDRFEAAVKRLSGTSTADSATAPRPYPVHIKLDTGMHRLGFVPGQVEELATRLAATGVLRVASVFSHLAASDETTHDTFSRQQLSLFSSLCDRIETALGYGFPRHICNSAAVSRFPEAHLDMVRLGIGLYGVSGDPSVQPLLQDVATFRSVVSQRKQVKAGDSVGYGRAARVRDDMELAIVPVGYADGLDRRLGKGRGSLWVNGRAAPLVGEVSMDMCAIDVTGLDVSEGDEVIVFGGPRSVSELAGKMDTIAYEVLCSVSQRVKRVFYQVGG